MEQGRWLLIEDIHLAPSEVLAALVPLLETGRLHIAQRAQRISAAPGFQLIATTTPAAGGSYQSRDLLGPHWAHVNLNAPSEHEQVTNIMTRDHRRL